MRVHRYTHAHATHTHTRTVTAASEAADKQLCEALRTQLDMVQAQLVQAGQEVRVCGGVLLLLPLPLPPFLEIVIAFAHDHKSCCCFLSKTLTFVKKYVMDCIWMHTHMHTHIHTHAHTHTHTHTHASLTADARARPCFCSQSCA